MKPALILATILFLAAVIDGSLRQWEADRAHDAAVGDCLARGGSLAQCEVTP
jgi:hypothetical protein